MRVVFVVLLAGCWTSPRPTGPAALLRRQHAPGDVLHVCERGDGRMTFAPSVKQAPITFVMRSVWDERMLAVQPHRFEKRSDTTSASIRMNAPGHDPIELNIAKETGTSVVIDDRNRPLDIPFPASPTTDSNEVKLGVTLETTDILGVAYPDRPVRQNETFPLRVRRTLYKEGVLPSELAIDATFTVTRVTPERIELTCKGTQAETVRRGKEHAEVEVTFTCRAELSRADGRSGRWWLDSRGRYAMSGTAAPADIAAHYDVSVGAADPAVCERVAEP